MPHRCQTCGKFAKAGKACNCTTKPPAPGPYPDARLPSSSSSTATADIPGTLPIPTTSTCQPGLSTSQFEQLVAAVRAQNKLFTQAHNARRKRDQLAAKYRQEPDKKRKADLMSQFEQTGREIETLEMRCLHEKEVEMRFDPAKGHGVVCFIREVGGGGAEAEAAEGLLMLASGGGGYYAGQEGKGKGKGKSSGGGGGGGRGSGSGSGKKR
ncbi:hypothetical protein QBC41DRAFT_388647 [Cercophora samala]|uniref:Uncharacterized protein n=1 Tax=Cercophora samala TaxID=330535 RepID=A0AA40DEA4_9PEZI|nr:hypothetical protein QBC41DRAFT_388647 [Cercophora samala]